jgi:hypothetical protein
VAEHPFGNGAVAYEVGDPRRDHPQTMLPKAATKMASFLLLRDEIDQWFSEYFNAFIDIGAGKIDPEKILLYWCVPLHTSGPKSTKWLKSSDEVVGVLNECKDF